MSPTLATHPHNFLCHRPCAKNYRKSRKPTTISIFVDMCLQPFHSEINGMEYMQDFHICSCCGPYYGEINDVDCSMDYAMIPAKSNWAMQWFMNDSKMNRKERLKRRRDCETADQRDGRLQSLFWFYLPPIEKPLAKMLESPKINKA